MARLSSELKSINEWEAKIKELPINVVLTESIFCKGVVTKLTGYATINGRKRILHWEANGRCYYRNQRIKQYDIKF